MQSEIFVKGARENNLKNIDVKIPRNKLVVFTGLSGSGKSSLAFETIFAEGQRRYMESLSSYARQFLGQMEKPDVDYIEGLSPAISIDQKTTSNNPRSTVGTVTEIYDYLRLLFARVGTPHCPKCGRVIEKQSVDTICDRVFELSVGSKIMIEAPVVRGKKGEFSKLFESLKKSGFARVKVDGSIYFLEEEIKLDKNLRHNIMVIVDRLIVKDDIRKRLTESIETALKLADGLVIIDNEGKEQLFSEHYSCPDCDISIEELTPRSFSFNSPFGACPECLGLGVKTEIDIDKIIPDRNKSIRERGLNIIGWTIDGGKMAEMYFSALANHYGFSLDTPIKDLDKKYLDAILYGTGNEKIEMTYMFDDDYTKTYMHEFEGLIPSIKRRFKETNSEYMKNEYAKLMKEVPCDVCNGKRLNEKALSVTVGCKNIYEVCCLSISECYNFFDNLILDETKTKIAYQILKEIKARLNFLKNVGLSYLTLARSAGTLSGGEAQRIRLATQIGSGLTGVLYILDEPSIGLHQRDNDKLLATLEHLRDLGNTLIVVEHDEDTIRKADYIVDIGPGAGIHGGELVACGSLEDIMKEPRSITGKYLSGKLKIDIPQERRKPDGRYIKVIGAKQNNLKNIDVNIPVGLFTVITGVSGSGKSSLINEILYPALAKKLNDSNIQQGNYDNIEGLEYFDKVVNIDQSPIGRTPRSNPATYTGMFTGIREIFAATPDAKERGYKSGRFSFNVKGGRCENCMGDGILKIEMHFLPDVYVPCSVCKGQRYNRETLEVKFKDKNIYDVLEMTVEEAYTFFSNIPSIFNKVKTLYEVGLGYIKLGQPATTLSGGEAQRVKLATELSKRSTGQTIYILDEPTTGLHVDDVNKLIKILLKLRENGNTIIVIEHNLDVIKTADYIIDLGPEGGDEGGRIIAEGSPEEIAKNNNSKTGYYLKKILF